MRTSKLVAKTWLGLLACLAFHLLQMKFGVRTFQTDKLLKTSADKLTTTALITYQPSQQLKHHAVHQSNALPNPLVVQESHPSQQPPAIQPNEPPEPKRPLVSHNKLKSSGSKPSNHRHLVSKIKDARHRRRRHRHIRHRHYRRQQPLLASSVPIGKLSSDQLQQFQAMMDVQQGNHIDQPSNSALTALESIVEEVARAGQQLVGTNNQSGSVAQQKPSPNGVTVVSPQPQQLTPGAGSDLLLDGSASPVIQIKANPNQQPPIQAPIQPTAAIQHPLTGARANPVNSKGFFLTTMLSKIMNVLNATEFAMEMRDGISSRASCMACNAVVGLFLSPLYSKEVFSAAIRTVCTSFKIQSARVCAGLVESFQDDLEYIRKNTKLTRDEVCGVVFGIDCARRPTYNLFWTVPIPLPPPKTHQSQKNQADSIQANENGQPGDSFINMEDAPDLFEYRRSNQALTNWSNHTTPSLDVTPKEERNMSPVLSNGRPHKDLKINQKSPRMLKRPEYIFDEQASDSNDNGAVTDRNKISTFVQITDIHIDPFYEPGSLSDCKEPLCCRATSGLVQPGDKRRQAGRWGDYGNCDLPVRTLHNALKRIRSHHPNAEYWLWTGDISPHDIWNISKSDAASHVRLVTKMIREYSNGLPVFPVIGNHEAHPVNSFSPPEIKGRFSMSWLYDLLADEWSEWLPKEALDTLRIGGYYRLHVRKGFRIIALNTNYCARLNPWSFYDPVDPANQLRWLVDELLAAEMNQDKVHIIGHVPPDNRECTQAWLFNFINIVDRFKDIIEAQFYGHTHRDELRVMYSLKGQGDEPIGIQFIGPSLTPFTENNPAYRIYHQDRVGRLVNSETYTFNLTEANSSPLNEPNWRFAYSAQEHLNMTSGLTGNDWHAYTQRLYENIEQFDTFFRNFYRNSDVKNGQICRNKCRQQILSDLRLAHPYKTKPKPFLANRKTSNHNHHHQLHQHLHHKRLRYTERSDAPVSAGPIEPIM